MSPSRRLCVTARPGSECLPTVEHDLGISPNIYKNSFVVLFAILQHENGSVRHRPEDGFPVAAAAPSCLRRTGRMHSALRSPPRPLPGVLGDPDGQQDLLFRLRPAALNVNAGFPHQIHAPGDGVQEDAHIL